MMGERMRRMMVVGLLGLLALAGSVQAQTRAWLDRDHVGAGEVVTLNIETDQAGASPDYTPLQADFELGGRTSGRQTRLVNGNISSSSLFGVVLVPRHAGSLQIPALRVGKAQTAPLSLQVDAAADAGSGVDEPANPGNAVAFIETEVDDPQPYVQQSVGVVVRLYFATQLASGELDQATPAAASLQRVGEDRTSSRDIGGRRYNVVERRFLLIPEHSGPLKLEGARFSGRGVGGFFDGFFGAGNGALSAHAADQVLQVRPIPATAAQPWLPLQDLRLRYVAAPQAARVGEAVPVEVEATAVGATHAQLPDLPVPAVGSAAQVFAEPVQYDESFDEGSAKLVLKRRYSIVPRQPGKLDVPGIRLRWWDVAAGEEREASLPPLQLQVAPGNAAAMPPAVAPPPATLPVAADTPAPAPARWSARALWPWPALAAGFALLWLFTLLWGVARRRAPAPATAAASVAAAGGRPALAELRRALDIGAFDEITSILAAMGGGGGVDDVIARLADPEQRQALERMQRARWAGGDDLAQVRARLREVFHRGPRWQVAERGDQPELEPLYPPRR